MYPKMQNIQRLADLISATGQEVNELEAQIAELEARKANKMNEFLGYTEEMLMTLQAKKQIRTTQKRPVQVQGVFTSAGKILLKIYLISQRFYCMDRQMAMKDYSITFLRITPIVSPLEFFIGMAT